MPNAMMTPSHPRVERNDRLTEKTMTKKFVAYYRVSTEQQGRSGLGLEAQRQIVEDYAAQQGAIVVEEFTDVMSGRSEARPELHKALQYARAFGATLIVAKLDRLARNARFLSEIVDGQADVIFCNLPQLPPGPVGRFMVQVMASIAELESGMISERTKQALQASKARGRELGGFRGDPTRLKGEAHAAGLERGRVTRTKRSEEFAFVTYERLKRLMAEGVDSYSQMARRLNEEGYRVATGKGDWTHTAVARVFKIVEKAHQREIEQAKARVKDLARVVPKKRKMHITGIAA